MTLHFLNDVAVTLNLHETRQLYVIIASVKSETTCKLIIRIPGSRLLMHVPSLPGSASRTLVESLGKPRHSTSVLEALPGKLDIKRHSPCTLYTLNRSSK